MLEQLAEVITPGSLFVNILLGFLIGAFYGYTLNPEGPPVYPKSLLLVGYAFIVTFAAWAVLTNSPTFDAIQQIGRSVLWTVMVSSIPIGRYTRHLLAEHSVIRWRDSSRPETQDQREDRQFGEVRRDLEQKHRDDE